MSFLLHKFLNATFSNSFPWSLLIQAIFINRWISSFEISSRNSLNKSNFLFFSSKVYRINVPFSYYAFYQHWAHQIHVEKFQHPISRGMLGHLMRQTGLLPHLKWSANLFFIFNPQIKDFTYKLCSNSILEVIIADVPNLWCGQSHSRVCSNRFWKLTSSSCVNTYFLPNASIILLKNREPLPYEFYISIFVKKLANAYQIDF